LKAHTEIAQNIRDDVILGKSAPFPPSCSETFKKIRAFKARRVNTAWYDCGRSGRVRCSSDEAFEQEGSRESSGGGGEGREA
jgi:hypothetical protein